MVMERGGGGGGCGGGGGGVRFGADVDLDFILQDALFTKRGRWSLGFFAFWKLGLFCAHSPFRLHRPLFTIFHHLLFSPLSIQIQTRLTLEAR